MAKKRRNATNRSKDPIPPLPLEWCIPTVGYDYHDEILDDDSEFYVENESDTHDNSYLMYAFQDDVHFGW